MMRKRLLGACKIIAYVVLVVLVVSTSVKSQTSEADYDEVREWLDTWSDDLHSIETFDDLEQIAIDVGEMPTDLYQYALDNTSFWVDLR